jgi:hypothetical protein
MRMLLRLGIDIRSDQGTRYRPSAVYVLNRSSEAFRIRSLPRLQTRLSLRRGRSTYFSAIPP